MKLTSKFQPFIENIVIGCLFIYLGRYIMVQFNESSFGLAGLAAIIWGGFKVFIGVWIYGIALWALMFRPESYKDIKEKRRMAALLKKVERDLQSNNIKKAKDRVHGFIMKYPNDLKLKYELAKLYLRDSDPCNAGRYLYLKPRPSQEEKECIKQFEKANGDDPFEILRKISKPSKISRDFVVESRNSLTQLVKRIKTQSQVNSWIVREYSYHLDEIDVPFYKKIWVDEKDVIIHVAILIALLAVTMILKA
jgi:hypothetical protein